MLRSYIFRLIDEERSRQHELHGDHTPANPDLDVYKKVAFITEEVGEVARAVQDSDRDNLIEELVQTAALCVAFLESL